MLFKFAILFVGAVVTFFTSYFSYEKNAEENLRKGMSNKKDIQLFYFFVFGLIITLTSGIVSIIDNDSNERALVQNNLDKIKREDDFKKKLDSSLAVRDSIHEYKDSLLTVAYGIKIDSSNAVNIRTTVKALAEYNLVLVDSLNKIVPKINAKGKEEPFLMIESSSPAGTSSMYTTNLNNEFLLKTKLVALYNICYNMNIDICVLQYVPVDKQTEKIGFAGCKSFSDGTSLAPGRVLTVNIDGESEWKKLKDAIVILSGTYSSDREGKNIIPFAAGCFFNFSTNKIDRNVNNLEMKGYLKFIKEYR